MTLQPPGKLIYEVVYGSHAHGTATPTSDVDTRGVFLLPNRDFLGLGRPTQTWEDKAADRVYWEAGQFCRLLLKGNPNIVGMLFVEKAELMTPMFAGLPQLRRDFLHTGTLKAYMGWVHRELADIGKLHKGNAKRLSHVPRLLWEIQDAVTERFIHVRLTGFRLQTVMAVKTGEMAYDDAAAYVGGLLLDVERRIEGYILPDPPVAETEAWLLQTRRLYGGE